MIGRCVESERRDNTKICQLRSGCVQNLVRLRHATEWAKLEQVYDRSDFREGLIQQAANGYSPTPLGSGGLIFGRFGKYGENAAILVVFQSRLVIVALSARFCLLFDGSGQQRLDH